ncbi:MAG: hypothetical protein ACOY5C_04640 [Pseudomonadota bacterium]|uniref:hypothetical protein n=1 Tax=Thermithiobacillus tepidarius TaxID=929 RepID=UPI00040D6D06|nr:hypothetical protein [Thermithiobacillus tepidarius]
MCLSIALVPLALGLFVQAAHPELLITDPQLALPAAIRAYASLPTQVLFFVALLSAGMSTASGALILALANSNIYELVGASAALTLVSLFVPRTAGLYLKQANTGGAVLPIVACWRGSRASSSWMRNWPSSTDWEPACWA